MYKQNSFPTRRSSDLQIQNSFYIFSSIIEGTQAIIATFQQKDEQLNKQASKIVQYLTLISEHFEKQQYTKVLEIIQFSRSEEHTSELQSRGHLVCRLL